jgi:hypothetical protein
MTYRIEQKFGFSLAKPGLKSKTSSKPGLFVASDFLKGFNRRQKSSGGEGGIRTHGTVSRTLAFEASTFNRSVTSPRSW